MLETSHLARRVPPQARRLPFVGALPFIARESIDYFPRARRAYGDIYEVDLGMLRMVMLNHPRHAQRVLRDQARTYGKGGALWDALRTYLGNGLLVSEGDVWLRQRRMLQPLFHAKRLAALTDLMVEAVEEVISTWDRVAAEGLPFDIRAGCSEVSMNVSSKSMFGSGMSRDEFDALSAEVAYVIDYMTESMLTRSVPAWVPLPGRRRYQQALQRIDRSLHALIDRCEQARQEGDGLLSMFLHLVDEETGAKMSPTQVRDEALNLFLGAYETTALSLAWLFHFLTQRPDVARRLRDEVDAAFTGRAPSFEDLSRLSYARRVVQEALRFYPPGFMITRMAREDDEMDGLLIPAGSTVAVVVYAIHHHPEVWDNPGVFDPDRFLPERQSERHRFAWIPFGGGPRVCMGSEFALMEAQVLLSMLIKRYDVRAVPGSTAEPRIMTTLAPKRGVIVRLARR